MLSFLTVVIMLALAYAFLNEGLFNAVLMLCNVVLAGLVTFNYWEPLADYLQSTIGVLDEYWDATCMVLLFCITLMVLRMAANSLAPVMVEFPALVQAGGAVAVSLVTGYLVAGFLVCVLQTLPWDEHFMGFNAAYEEGDTLRQYLPPDRVWLAMMTRAGAYPLSDSRDPDPENYDQFVKNPDPHIRQYFTFDKYSTFEPRYARYRRYGERRNALPYTGEMEGQLHPPEKKR